MNPVRTTVILAFSLAAACGQAADIRWNTFVGQESYTWIPDGEYSGEWGPAYNVHSYGPFGTPEVNFGYALDARGRIVEAAPDGSCNVGAPMAYWVFARAGEVLADLADFQAHDLVFECHCDGIHRDLVGEGIELGPFTETYYLALLGGENFDDYWGWVELEGNWTDGLSVVSSALTRDGPLIVGGGLANPGPIPEPTGGLLLLAGSALIALRRRT